MFTANVPRLILLAALAWPTLAATFGTVVPIGGHGSDLALDERRGLLYVANFTANRIEVMSTWDKTLRTPIPVAAQPASIALSPNGRYLVVAHYAKWVSGVTASPSITVLDLDAGTRRNIAMASSPLAVAFGAASTALVVTGEGFKLLDPALGALQTLVPVPMAGADLPAKLATFPPQIVQASAGVSGDGKYIVGLAGTEEQEEDKTVHFIYNVETREVAVTWIVSSPILGPRVVSVDQTGNSFMLGWGLWDANTHLLAQFPYVKGDLNIGTTAFDWSRSLIYAQIPLAVSGDTVMPPELHVVDSDNLTVRERIQLAENLAGRSQLSSDHSTMYAISDSGVMILPVGELSRSPRVAASKEDLLFRGSFCDRRTMTQEIAIVDLGGGSVDFKLSTTMAGVSFSQTTGTTPATVTVFVDPGTYQNMKGTSTGTIQITSKTAVNVPAPVRLLVNTREPEQRGAIFNVPGTLVDILSDPVRDRFYVLRQDKNQVQVFNASTYEKIATLRTGNTPTQMAITYDRRWLLVASDNSQIINRYDLDRLEALPYIALPVGHYPRAIGVSSNAVLVSVRGVAEPVGCPDGTGLHTIDRIDFDTLRANTLPTLGVYCNDIAEGTALVSSPDGSHILAAMDDGNVLLYEAETDTFVASRQDFNELGGAIAALGGGFYAVDNHLLNRSLVPFAALETTSGLSSGFAMLGATAVRTTAPSMNAPGVIQRVELTAPSAAVSPAKMIEAPLLPGSMATQPDSQVGRTILPFLRTLAVPANGLSVISLTVSGFTVLPVDFDAFLAKPVIQSVVNLADGASAIAPGGLIAIRGANLSRMTVTNSELPVPTTLAEACVTVNNLKTPLLMVSPEQINGQLPAAVAAGKATFIVRTAGGTSDPFTATVSATAPAVFQTASAGPATGLPALYRFVNYEPVTLSNPVHPEDYLVIFVTGLGATTPAVDDGAPASADPYAVANNVPVVRLGGTTLPVLYAGLVPGQVGVYQINVYVPENITLGTSVPLVITRPGGDVSMSVRVVR